MSVQVIQNQAGHWDIWVGLVHQLVYPVVQVLHGTLLGDGHVDQARPALADGERVAGTSIRKRLICPEATDRLRSPLGAVLRGNSWAIFSPVLMAYAGHCPSVSVRIPSNREKYGSQ